MQMLWLCEMLKGRGNIVMLGGIAGAGPAEERAAGAREVLSAFPGINVLDFQYTNWSPSEGKRIMSALIQTYGNRIDGVWGDGVQNAGAIEALKDAGIVIPITGDHNNGFLVRVQKWGYPAMSIDFPVSMGTDAVDVALKIPWSIFNATSTDAVNVKSDLPWSQMAHFDWPDDAWNNTLPKKWLPY
jgi:ribose transport system substrate-binding protein